MKFLYGLSVGLLFAGQTFAKNCAEGQIYDLSQDKCVDGCHQPESCMDATALDFYLNSAEKDRGDFGVNCASDGVCECSHDKGYVQSDAAKKSSICTSPSEKCTDTSGKYQEYECDETVCKCKNTNFNYCELQDNACHEQGDTCESVAYADGEEFKDHVCGSAPNNMIVDPSTNEYVCKPGTKMNGEKCQKLVTCKKKCKNNKLACLNINDFQNICHSRELSCDKPKSGLKEDVKCNCKSSTQRQIGGFKEGCMCIEDHIKVDQDCEKHDQFCSENSCLDTQSCTNGTVSSQLTCEDNCKYAEDIYTNQNKTCEGTTGKIDCIEGFEISSEEGAENVCTPNTNQGTMIYLVIAVVAVLAIVMGVIMFLKSRNSGGYTGGANSGGVEDH